MALIHFTEPKILSISHYQGRVNTSHVRRQHLKRNIILHLSCLRHCNYPSKCKMKRIRFQELRHGVIESPRRHMSLGEGQKRYDNMQKIRESEKNNFENLVSPPTPNFTAEKLYSERLTDLLILQVSYRMK